MSLFGVMLILRYRGIVIKDVQWAFGNTVMKFRSTEVGNTDSIAVNVNVLVVART